MNIDEMPANRELDILIARKVMGWEVRLMSYNYANLPDDCQVFAQLAEESIHEH
jgi:hypothetical protein